MKYVVSCSLFFLATMLFAQTESDSLGVDHKYLEDQFYIGITYNFLVNKPDGISQQSLSYGLQGGFIKDIPVNADRTVALGLGLGYGTYSYYSQLLASNTNGAISYASTVDLEDFKRNKLETHMVELPIEFRWRKSTPIEYKFWRVYAGVKLSYVMGARSKLVTNSRIAFANTDVTKFQYGLTLNLGWNTFNLHGYYALNKLFQDQASFNGAPIDMQPLRIGFIFYIL